MKNCNVKLKLKPDVFVCLKKKFPSQYLFGLVDSLTLLVVLFFCFLKHIYTYK